MATTDIPTQQRDIRTFYDQFVSRHLTDYIRTNPRTVAAIRHALAEIPPDATRVLEIGCSIGWLAWEIKRHFPNVSVLGIDISPALLKTAHQLFPNPRINFLVDDVTVGGGLAPNSCDAIIMLDVYEHIPRHKRVVLHQMMRSVLKPTGVVIVTCPSSLHQEYLRTHRPDALQPVDEDVLLADLQQLAQDIDGEVVTFAYQTIWRPNDYLHAVVQKRPIHHVHARILPQSHPQVRLESDATRYRRVKRTFGAMAPKRDNVLLRIFRRVRRRLRGAANIREYTN